MRLRLLITAQARSDLKEIRAYIAARNEDVAKAIIAQIVGAFEQLRDMPMIGRQ